jgi:uncharacterized protein (DUF1800 family)
MGISSAGVLSAAAIVAIAVAAPRPPASAPGSSNNKAASQKFQGKLPITELSEDEAILHALNRLGFGPRPGEVDEIKKNGLESWVQAQLHPETLDDSDIEGRLSAYPSLRLSAANLLNEYPPPDVAAKRMGVTVDEYRKRMDALAHPPQGIHPAPSTDQQQIVDELMEAKLLRAIYSPRQLTEQLADFWFNHFNVFVYKDTDRWYLIPYERDAIRPHVLGKFRDLLEASAKSPAMLFYLDNYVSADPRSFDRLKAHPIPAARNRELPPLGGKRGLNENYGRELLELHTLGVDGGYSQQDVIEVARAFTGWTITSPRENPEFYFDDRVHDPDVKKVLGKKIHAGGIKDAEQVLDLLAKNPHTAHHISLLLAQRFVSDNPPDALVQRMAKTFAASKGDIRAVMTTMIYSPEFWSRAAYRAKVKTPFELVASTARALGADVDQPLPMVGWISRMGEPLYQCLTPDGYTDKGPAWISTGSLLNRLNFAIALSSNKVRGAEVELNPLVGADASGNPQLALQRVVGDFLAGQLSHSTQAELDTEMADPLILGAKLDDPVRQLNLGLIAGLVLGSPEFQQR